MVESFVECAFRSGISALYVRMPRLVQELKVARADGSYIKLLQRLQRMKLLIIDDWGLNPFTDETRRDLLEILEDRALYRQEMDRLLYPGDSERQSCFRDNVASEILCNNPGLTTSATSRCLSLFLIM